MKKIFVLLAIAATLSAVSCSKKNADEKKPKNNGESEYVQPIKIDGDFSDWAKLDASKVATATCDPDATKTALKLVKVYADKVFVFIYFEWDKEEVPHYAPTNPEDPNTGAYAPFHIYMNGDGSTATGGFAGQWSDAATDVLFEGTLYPDGVNLASYEPSLFSWAGEVNGSEWAWTSLGDISGICAGAGVEGKYEISIVRELYPIGKLADTFSLGIDIQDAGWNSVGILPIGHVEEGVEGSTEIIPSLTVVTNK